MQTLVNYFNALLQSWNAITLQNTVLELITTGLMIALCFWFLLALYYHSKIAKVRACGHQAVAAIEQQRVQANQTLEATAQQLLHTEQELGDKHQQLQAAQQVTQTYASRGEALEKQIAAALTQLKMAGFAPAAPLIVANAEETASCWPHYQVAVNELTNHATALQQEKIRLNAVLTDNALSIQNLQQKIAVQTDQITRLDRTIAAQHVSLEQAQQSLAEADQQPAQVPAYRSAANFNESVSHSEENQHLTETANAASATLMDEAEEIIEDVVSGFKSVFQSDEQPIAAGPAKTADSGSSIPKPIGAGQPAKPEIPKKPASLAKLKSIFSFGNSSLPAKPAQASLPTLDNQPPSAPINAEKAIDSIPTTAQILNGQSAEPLDKKRPLKSLFRHFNKSPKAEQASTVLKAETYGAEGSHLSKPSLKTETPTGAAPPPIPPSTVISVVPEPLSTPSLEEPPMAPVTKQGVLKRWLGRFNKNAITDFVETALEQNDANVAEQAIEDAATENPDLPEKANSFWRKMTFSK